MDSRAGKIVRIVTLMTVAVAVRFNEVLDSEDMELRADATPAAKLELDSEAAAQFNHDTEKAAHSLSEMLSGGRGAYEKQAPACDNARQQMLALPLNQRWTAFDCGHCGGDCPCHYDNGEEGPHCFLLTQKASAASPLSYDDVGRGHCQVDGKFNIAGCVMRRNGKDADDASCQAICDKDATCTGFAKGGGTDSHSKKCYIYTDSASDAHCASILTAGDEYTVANVRGTGPQRESAAKIDGSDPTSREYEYCKRKQVDVNCVEIPPAVSQCTAECGTLSYTVETPQSGNGDACPGQVYQCQPGNGECPANPYTSREWEVKDRGISGESNCCACFAANDKAFHETEFSKLACADKQALCQACENWWSMGKHYDTYSDARGQCVTAGLANSCDKPRGLETCVNSKPAKYPPCDQALPSTTATPEDNDYCLQQSPGWGDSYLCASSTEYCEDWVKDMQRCCPKSCGTGELTATACAASSKSGTCVYPRPTQVLPSTTAAYVRAAGGTDCPPELMVTTKVECEKAAGPAVRHPFEKQIPTDSEHGRPKGCFWDRNGKSYFNPVLSGVATSDWGGVGGICKVACSIDAPFGYCPSGQVCNQGVCVAEMDKFYIRAAGGKDCPAGSMVDTKVECEKAAGPAVRHPFEKQIPIDSDHGRPAGCFWDRNGKSYFNPKLTGIESDWGGVGGICKAYYKAPGAQNCPDATMVKTKEECGIAAQMPGLSLKFDTTTVSDENLRPAGCFWHTNGNAYFNDKLTASVKPNGNNDPWAGVGGICKTEAPP